MSELRVLELFCGIGGCAAALGPAARVAGAFDVSRLALGLYARNFPPHPAAACTVESLTAERLAACRADLWWMSPPCQPFTRRGRGRDDDDPRSAGLLALLGRIAEVHPPYLALENVPEFAGSRCHERLRAILGEGGYRVRERVLCPSDLGVPNRRRRFYLLASRGRFAPEAASATRPGRPLAAYLDPDPDPGLAVDPDLVRRYEGALDLVSPGDPRALTACFTSAYGRSPVHSGSYLATAEGVRRFSPAEVLRLLGFPAGFTLPPDLPREKAWRLLGASLSLPAVRAVLAQVPELAAALAREESGSPARTRSGAPAPAAPSRASAGVARRRLSPAAAAGRWR